MDNDYIKYAIERTRNRALVAEWYQKNKEEVNAKRIIKKLVAGKRVKPSTIAKYSKYIQFSVPVTAA